jgi:hydroxymethylbilane synthase
LLVAAAARRGTRCDIEVVVVETQGDRRLDVPIWSLGGKGVFAKEVQAAVLEGRADLAVHSAKDLPSLTPDGLVLAAVPERGDPRDALVGYTLADLPEGAEVATGSLRRQAQLGAVRPDLAFVGLRGNIATRLARVADHDAVVVAATALDRLGLADRIAERLEPEVMLPQVAQGALAVECRLDAEDLLDLLSSVEHVRTRRCVDAERAFLAELGGDCSLPAAAHATLIGDRGHGHEGHRPDESGRGPDEDSPLTVTGLLAAPDGSSVLRHRVTGGDPCSLGRALARHLLDEQGGAALLARLAR